MVCNIPIIYFPRSEKQRKSLISSENLVLFRVKQIAEGNWQTTHHIFQREKEILKKIDKKLNHILDTKISYRRHPIRELYVDFPRKASLE